MSSEEDVEYSQLPRARRPAMDRREIFSQDEGSDEEMEREDNPACRDYSRKMCRLLPDTRRCHGRVTLLELVGIQRTHGQLKELLYSHKTYMSILPSLMVRAASSPILCS